MSNIIDRTKRHSIMSVKFATLFSFIITTAAQQANAEVTVRYPDFQRDFMTIIVDYKYKYLQAENQLLKSSLVSERLKSFEKLKGNPRQINNWIGVLEKMGTNSDGKAYVVISLSPPPNTIKVSTWNNAISDIQDKTLIPQGGATYANLSSMKEGNVVKFSGQLKRSTNITEAGKMTEPEFLFKFTNIEKIGDRVTK